MKKLFLVKTLTYDGSDPVFLYVNETDKEAANRAFVDSVYSVFPCEIAEVDGYEVKLVKKEGND